jgi:hypothetical protein
MRQITGKLNIALILGKENKISLKIVSGSGKEKFRVKKFVQFTNVFELLCNIQYT